MARREPEDLGPRRIPRAKRDAREDDVSGREGGVADCDDAALVS